MTDGALPVLKFYLDIATLGKSFSTVYDCMQAVFELLVSTRRAILVIIMETNVAS